jgi:hypothetical protein
MLWRGLFYKNLVILGSYKILPDWAPKLHDLTQGYSSLSKLPPVALPGYDRSVTGNM